MQELQQKTYKIVFTGEVDHGKSTLISNLLVNYSGAEISPEERGELYLVDSYQEERIDSITIDTSQFFLEIDGYAFVLIDVPGHFEYLSNMVTGASHADIGVVTVDIMHGVTEKTKLHLNILHMLSIPKAIGIVTKTDLLSGKELEEKIEQTSIELEKEARSLFSAYSATAVSGLTGENIYDRDEARWRSSASLIDNLIALAAQSLENEGEKQEPARIIIQNIFEYNEKPYALGFVDSGYVSPGDSLSVFGKNRHVEIQELRDANHNPSAQASSEQSIAILFSEPNHIRRGTILCLDEGELRHSMSHIELHTLWLDDSKPITGSNCTLQCAVQKIPARIKKVNISAQDQVKGSFMEISFDLDDPLFLTFPNESNYLGVANILMNDQVVGVGVAKIR